MMSHLTRPLSLVRNVAYGLTIALLAVPPAEASSPHSPSATPSISEYSAIRVDLEDRAQLQHLTRLVSIDTVRGLQVWATASGPQLDELRRAGFSWRVVAAPAKADTTACPDGWVDDDDRSWSCYPSYEQYTSMMTRFATRHPDLCRLVDLGPTTNTQRPHRLLAVIVSDNPGLEEAEPEVLLTSSIHGDETTGYVLTLRLIDHLLERYQENQVIAKLVDTTEIWINPLANPDGTYYGGDHSVAGAIRHYTTATGGNSGVDGNRNFPDPTGADHPDGHSWWRETEAMMALAESENFVLSANFHGGAEVVNYPWDTWQRRHPDTDWLIELSSNWADLAQADSPGGYMTDPYNSGFTNGWDWYETRGSRQDWITYFEGGREVTIELSSTKLLAADDLDDHWRWNRRALIDFIGRAHFGVRGRVTDRNGNPLAATIEVVGVDSDVDNSAVRTDPDVGDFHRLLLPGLYDLRFTADGFQPRLVKGVAVTGEAATVLDIELYEELMLRPSRRVAPAP